MVADGALWPPWEVVSVGERSRDLPTDMEDYVDGQVESASCESAEKFFQIGTRAVLVDQEVNVAVTACIEGLNDRGVMERRRADVFA